jgi:hypothetical protein
LSVDRLGALVGQAAVIVAAAGHLADRVVSQQQGQINAIVKSLKGATITAACDPATSAITVTLNLTKLP